MTNTSDLVAAFLARALHAARAENARLLEIAALASEDRRVILVIYSDGELEIEGFSNTEAAREALMRDIYEMGQDTDLPESDTDEAITAWLRENEIEYVWKIQALDLPCGDF